MTPFWVLQVVWHLVFWVTKTGGLILENTPKYNFQIGALILEDPQIRFMTLEKGGLPSDPSTVAWSNGALPCSSVKKGSALRQAQSEVQFPFHFPVSFPFDSPSLGIIITQGIWNHNIPNASGSVVRKLAGAEVKVFVNPHFLTSASVSKAAAQGTWRLRLGFLRS